MLEAGDDPGAERGDESRPERRRQQGLGRKRIEGEADDPGERDARQRARATRRRRRPPASAARSGVPGRALRWRSAPRPRPARRHPPCRCARRRSRPRSAPAPGGARRGPAPAARAAARYPSRLPPYDPCCCSAAGPGRIEVSVPVPQSEALRDLGLKRLGTGPGAGGASARNAEKSKSGLAPCRREIHSRRSCKCDWGGIHLSHVRSCPLPRRGGLGGRQMVVEPNRFLLGQSVGFRLETLAGRSEERTRADRHHPSVVTRNLPFGVDPYPLSPMTLSRRVRHCAANACVSRIETPKSSKSSSSGGANGGRRTASATGSDSTRVRWIACR